MMISPLPDLEEHHMYSMDRNSSTSLDNVTLRSFPGAEDDAEWQRLDKLAFDIETYYLWGILALGFPGNCFTIVTIIKMSPSRSLTVYIALLAIVDNLAIVNKILMFFLTDNGVQIGNFGCKFLGFCGNFLITYGNWLLVGLSVERCAAVWFPIKIGQIWTFKKSLCVVMSITIPLLALFSHLFWTMDYSHIAGTNYVFCKVNEDHLFFMMHVWFWINVIVYAVLPCALLIVFNMFIVCGIVRANATRNYLMKSESNSAQTSVADRQRQITIMLVTASVILVVLTTPRCVLLILSPHLNPLNSSKEGATLYLVDTIAYVLCDSTHAINFYLYSLSAKRFRLQFRKLMTCRKQRRPSGIQEYMTMTSRQSVRVH